MDKMTIIVTEIKTAENKVKEHRVNIAKIDLDINEKQKLLQKTYNEIFVTTPELEKLRSEQLVFQDGVKELSKAFGYIAQTPIVYRSSIWPDSLRNALKLINRTFDAPHFTEGKYSYDSLDPDYILTLSNMNQSGDLVSFNLSLGAQTHPYKCDGFACTAPGFFGEIHFINSRQFKRVEIQAPEKVYTLVPERL